MGIAFIQLLLSMISSLFVSFKTYFLGQINKTFVLF